MGSICIIGQLYLTILFKSESIRFPALAQACAALAWSFWLKRFSLPRRTRSSVLLGWGRCTPRTCIAFARPLEQHQPWGWGPPFDFYFAWSIPISGRFCFPRRSWAHRPRCPSALGTTESHICYFFGGIDEWRRLYDWKNDEEDISIGIGERAQSIVFFLACCVPKAQVDHPVIKLHSGGVVIKDSGHVLARELVLGVAGSRWGYLMRRQVFPTAPSPTTTTLMGMGYSLIINQLYRRFWTSRICNM